jgi:hypothetical protein
VNERNPADGSLAAIRYWLEAGQDGVRARSGRRRRVGRHAMGSRETGFSAAGAKYYVWQEELAEAEAWAATLAPLDAARRSRA